MLPLFKQVYDVGDALPAIRSRTKDISLDGFPREFSPL